MLILMQCPHEQQERSGCGGLSFDKRDEKGTSERTARMGTEATILRLRAASCSW